MRVQVKKEFSLLKLVGQRAKKLDGKAVEIGWFQEQGTHYSGYTYPQLVAIHHNGIEVPKRPILSILSFLYSPENNRRNLTKHIKTLTSSLLDGGDADVLDEMGKHYVRLLKRLFGSVHLFPTSYNPNPLIDTGDLRQKASYRVEGGSIKTIKR